jgi:antibiotic biosynthesis monooxygenase (ABM) superfamily enzyme
MMKRRQYVKTILAGAAAAALPAAVAHPIQLHCDLAVDPAKEQQMLKAFRTTFRPEAMKHPGYIDVRILKLNKAFQGAAPAGANYRFELTFESEALRQKWINSPEHQKVWPMIENTLSSKNYTVFLYDDATNA